MTKGIKVAKLSDMEKGWFIGNFNPSLLKTEVVEVAVKHYKAGDSEKEHYHKAAREFTVIVSGKVKMHGQTYSAGDIIVIERNTPSDFEALTDAITTVVKAPGARNDKYPVNNP